MAYGSTSQQITDGWRQAIRRGVVLGSVASLHLAMLALLLHPPPGRPAPGAPRSAEALRIRFLPPPARPTEVHQVRPAPSRPAAPRHVTIDVRSRRTTSAPTLSDTGADIAAPPPPVHATASDYHPGAFGADLLDAQRSRRARLPGTDAPPRTGIRLRARTSMKDTVHAMTVGNRCKYERMKMQGSTTQFITPQLMERALDADGCGPGGKRTPADAVIDAASHQAIFGN